MTDGTSPNTAAPANKGVKQGLPAIGLPTAELAINKLWTVARLGTTSPEAFARQFGDKAKASGGAWDTRMAVLRGFKLIRTEAKQIGLSELGQQMVDASNPAGQRKARRTAMLSLKAYRELIESFDGTELPDVGVLATRLQFEYGKTEEFAKRAAQAFTESLQHAEMSDAQKVVHSGEMPAAAASTAESESIDDRDEAEEIDAAFEEEATDDAKSGGLEQPAGTSPGISLTVSLDLSDFTADEVIKILRVLGLGTRDE